MHGKTAQCGIGNAAKGGGSVHGQSNTERRNLRHGRTSEVYDRAYQGGDGTCRCQGDCHGRTVAHCVQRGTDV